MGDQAPAGGKMSTRTMTFEYLLVLTVLAFLSSISYRGMLRIIDMQTDDAALVNLSGRQRMLSQRIMAFSHLMTTAAGKAERAAARSELYEAIDAMRVTHEALTSRPPPDELPPALRAIYLEPPHLLEEKTHGFLAAAQALADLPDARSSKRSASLDYVRALATEGLIGSLDAAADRYQLEGEEHVAMLKKGQKRVLGLILLLLAIAGLSVFRPMVARVSGEHAALVKLNGTLEERVAQRGRQIEELRDRYYHNVSHELRTPITCLNAAFQAFLVELRGTLTPRQEQYLAIGLRNSRHLTAMIDDLLALTSVETGKLSLKPMRTSLADQIRETVESLRLVAAPKRILLKTEVPDVLPEVHADPERLVQILTNLIGNAIKFTPENEQITIRAGVCRDDEGFIEVSVTDKGCGIKQEEAARIFERLYQVAPRTSPQRGLGLGLYITKQIVDQHGGRIWVTSEPGRGSTFTFTIPAAGGPLPMPPAMDARAAKEFFVKLPE